MLTSEDPLKVLRTDLFERPSASLLLAARYLADLSPREYLPDWVAILANGNVDKWESVCDVARADIKAEEMALMHHGSQRGQGVVEFALILFGLAVAALLLMGLMTETPAGRAMTEQAAAAMADLQAQVQLSEHATVKHGSDAVAVQECLVKNGTYQIWKNPQNNRLANICHLDDGRFGLFITEETGDPVTAFIKNKMRDFADVVRYLENSGYKPLQ